MEPKSAKERLAEVCWRRGGMDDLPTYLEGLIIKEKMKEARRLLSLSQNVQVRWLVEKLGEDGAVKSLEEIFDLFRPKT